MVVCTGVWTSRAEDNATTPPSRQSPATARRKHLSWIRILPHSSRCQGNAVETPTAHSRRTLSLGGNAHTVRNEARTNSRSAMSRSSARVKDGGTGGRAPYTQRIITRTGWEARIGSLGSLVRRWSVRSRSVPRPEVKCTGERDLPPPCRCWRCCLACLACLACLSFLLSGQPENSPRSPCYRPATRFYRLLHELHAIDALHSPRARLLFATRADQSFRGKPTSTRTD